MSSKNPEAFARNVAACLKSSAKAAITCRTPVKRAKLSIPSPNRWPTWSKTFSKVGEICLSIQTAPSKPQTSLLTQFYFRHVERNRRKRMSGEEDSPRAKKRKENGFLNPDWDKQRFFEFWKNRPISSLDWANKLVDESEGLGCSIPVHKAAFMCAR